MDSDHAPLVRFRLRGTVRVLARVIDSGPTGGTVELLGSGERVTLTGRAWREVESYPVRGSKVAS
jgi:hypothetical protein